MLKPISTSTGRDGGCCLQRFVGCLLGMGKALLGQKLRERLGLSFHGPNFYGCTEYLPVRDERDLTPTARGMLDINYTLAEKFGVVFHPGDFKKGDIIRLKKHEDILVLSGAACVVHELLLKLDECCKVRDELLAANKCDNVSIHNDVALTPNVRAEPQPMWEVNRDSGTGAANGCWLQRLC